MEPWRRARLPLLYCDGELVWVPGIGIDAAWQATPGEAGLSPVWRLAALQGGAQEGASLQSRDQ
jgi:tRNA(Ile)-lysidine synthase